MRLLNLLSLIAVCLANPLPLENQSAVKCGLPATKPDTTTSIVGGVDAIPYSWPWQVALFRRDRGYEYQFCGGTLISNEWILSAGHCFYGPNHTPDEYYVKLGVFNKTYDDEPGEVVLNISAFHMHPKFEFVRETGTPIYDVSLVKLKTPVQFTDHITPICLPSTLDEELPNPDTKSFIVGWGFIKETVGPDSDTLKQAGVPLVSVETCRKGLENVPSKDKDVHEKVEFCAGFDQGGKSQCSGDSGGPLMYQDPSNEGRWKQLGITSWSVGCAKPKLYGVYSKVSAFMDFVKDYVKDL